MLVETMLVKTTQLETSLVGDYLQYLKLLLSTQLALMAHPKEKNGSIVNHLAVNCVSGELPELHTRIARQLHDF